MVVRKKKMMKTNEIDEWDNLKLTRYSRVIEPVIPRVSKFHVSSFLFFTMLLCTSFFISQGQGITSDRSILAVADSYRVTEQNFVVSKIFASDAINAASFAVSATVADKTSLAGDDESL